MNDLEEVEKIENPEVTEIEPKDMSVSEMIKKSKQILDDVSTNVKAVTGGNQFHNIEVDDVSDRICTVKFLFNKEVIYQFDLFKVESPSEIKNLDTSQNTKYIKMKNIYNNFNKFIPKNPRKLGDFFKMYGLIRYVFSKTYIPISEKTTEDDIVVTFENKISNYIHNARIRKFEIQIDRG